MSAKEVTRARASSAEVEERIAHIMAIMRRGCWDRGESAGPLAEEWDVAVATVEGYSAEAWRRVCAAADDAAAARPTIAGTLAVTLERAAKAGEYKAVASIADVWSKVVGARAPEKHQHQVVVAQFEALPPAGKVAWLRERAAALLEEAARLEADAGG